MAAIHPANSGPHELERLLIQAPQHARKSARVVVSTSRADGHRAALAALADARTLPLFAKANVAEGVSMSPFGVHAIERWAMTVEEAYLLQFALTAGWQYRLEVISQLSDMSPIERHDFERTIRTLYGQANVHGVFYQKNLNELGRDWGSWGNGRRIGCGRDVGLSARVN